MMERAAGRGAGPEIGALGPRHREHDDRGAVGRDAQQFPGPVLVAEDRGDPRRAQAAGPQGHAEAPGRLDHGVEQAGPAAAVVPADDRDEDQGRHLGQVLGQVGGRGHDLLLRVPGPGQPPRALGHPRPGLLVVQVREGGSHRRVTDDDPAAAAQVPAGGGLLGDIDAVQQELVVHVAVQVQATPDRPRGGQGRVHLCGVDRHGSRIARRCRSSPGRDGGGSGAPGRWGA